MTLKRWIDTFTIAKVTLSLSTTADDAPPTLENERNLSVAAHRQDLEDGIPICPPGVFNHNSMNEMNLA